MIYNIKISFCPDELIQTYCENNSINISECELSVEEILEQELCWLNSSSISVEEVKELKDHYLHCWACNQELKASSGLAPSYEVRSEEEQ